MASPLEVEVAELMTTLVPGLEQVRFMKTGNDANSAAVRLARALYRPRSPGHLRVPWVQRLVRLWCRRRPRLGSS